MTDLPATDNQIKNLFYHARLNGLTKQEVETEAFRRWNKGAYSLTRQEMTSLTTWVQAGGEGDGDDTD